MNYILKLVARTSQAKSATNSIAGMQIMSLDSQGKMYAAPPISQSQLSRHVVRPFVPSTGGWLSVCDSRESGDEHDRVDEAVGQHRDPEVTPGE